MAPRLQSQGSQMFKSTGKGGVLRGDPQAAQPRGGFRDSTLRGGHRGKGKPAELAGGHREGSSSREGVCRDSPSYPPPFEFAVWQVG